MKITIISALGLSLFRSVEGSLGALVSNPRISTLGHAEVVSEPLEGSNLQRALEINKAEYSSVIDSVECSVKVDEEASSTNFATITCSVQGTGDGNSYMTASLKSVDDCQTSIASEIAVTFRPDMSWEQSGPSSYEYILTTEFEITLPNTSVEFASRLPQSESDNLDWCLKVELLDYYDRVMYWKGTIVELQINSNNGVSTTGMTTTPFNGMEDIQTDKSVINFSAMAYRCNGNGNAMNQAPPLVLGENFFICLEAMGDGNLQITDLIDSEFTKGDFFLQPKDLETYYLGWRTNKVVMATRLPLQYFENDAPVKFHGYLEVEINADNPSGNRRLVRIMQEDTTDEKTADFSMDIAIVAGIPGSASGASVIKSTVAMAVFFGAGAVFAALF